jgi:hypothetical protein
VEAFSAAQKVVETSLKYGVAADELASKFRKGMDGKKERRAIPQKSDEDKSKRRQRARR